MKELIDQFLHFHPNIRTMHMGTDDIDIIQQCSKCRRTGMTPAELYLFHMTPLIRHVNEKGISVMLWDDFIRDWPLVHLETLAEEDVQVVVWNSSPDLDVRSPASEDLKPVYKPGILRNIVWNNYEVKRFSCFLSLSSLVAYRCY